MRGDEHAHSVTGFVLAVFAFFVAMVGATLPTPLYPLFEQRYGFGSLLVTVIFGIYAFGVIGGLILFGNLSDRVGRKPLLVLGLVLSAASALLFLFAGSLTPIYVARVVSGFSAGIFTGTATAYVIDLAPPAVAASRASQPSSRTSVGSAPERFWQGFSASGHLTRCGRPLRSTSVSSAQRPWACCSCRKRFSTARSAFGCSAWTCLRR